MKFAWPPKQATIFCLALCLFAGVMALAQPVPESSFCAADEKTVAVCLRNWVNAAGNLLTVLVAVAAATFAFRQWQAADQQVASALIPALEKRLAEIAEAKKTIGEIRLKLVFITLGIETISLSASGVRSIDRFIDKSESLETDIDELYRIRKKLGAITDDVSKYLDVMHACRESQDISDIHPDAVIFKAIEIIENRKMEFISRNKVEPIPDSDEADNVLALASRELKIRQARLLDEEKNLLVLAADVHKRRLAALKLSTSN